MYLRRVTLIKPKEAFLTCSIHSFDPRSNSAIKTPFSFHILSNSYALLPLFPGQVIILYVILMRLKTNKVKELYFLKKIKWIRFFPKILDNGWQQASRMCCALLQNSFAYLHTKPVKISSKLNKEENPSLTMVLSNANRSGNGLLVISLNRWFPKLFFHWDLSFKMTFYTDPPSFLSKTREANEVAYGPSMISGGTSMTSLWCCDSAPVPYPGLQYWQILVSVGRPETSCLELLRAHCTQQDAK